MAGISEGFLSTSLSWLTNSIYKIRTEQYCDRRFLVDGLLISIIIGLLTGGLAFGHILFDANTLKDRYVLFDASVLKDDNSVESTFVSMYLTAFFSSSIDALLGIVRQASSRLFDSKDID